jgi:hypothetical protein
MSTLAPSYLATLAPPETHDPMLAGCKWAGSGSRFLSLRDECGNVLGIGSSPDSVAKLAIRVRTAASGVQPEGYYDCLAGCHFVSHPRPGNAAIWPGVATADGKVIALAPTRQAAALAAARQILRQQDTSTLSLEDFRHICTVITVDVARGKTGKAKSGPPYLRMDTRDDPDAVGYFRALVGRILVDTRAGQVDFHAYDVRAQRISEMCEQLLSDNYFDDATNAIRLDNGEWLLLRKPDATPGRRCVEMAYETLMQAELQPQLDSQRGELGEARAERPRN